MDIKTWMTGLLPSLADTGNKIFRSVLVLVILWVASKILHLAVGNTLRSGKDREGKYFSSQRVRTLESLLKSVVSYGAGIIGFMYLVTLWLGTAGITLAGVGGVALGFGAQSIIKDMFAGIFILAEDKYKIGDYVTLGDSSGFVEEIALRTTVLRGYNGDIHMVPNGSVDVVTNVSRGMRRLMVEIPVDSSLPMDRVFKAMGEGCSVFNEKHPDITEKPRFIGITGADSGMAVVRVQGKTTYPNQFSYENALREDIMDAFRKEGISLRPSINTSDVKGEEEK